MKTKLIFKQKAKTSILFFTFVINIFFAIGQESNSKTVSFKDGTRITINNLSADNFKFPKLVFSSGLMVGTRPLSQVDILLPLQVSFMFPHVGFISIKTDNPILKDFDNQYDFLHNRTGLSTLNKFKVYRVNDAKIGFCLFDRDIQQKRKVTLKSSHYQKATTNYNARFKLPTRYSVSIAGGILNYNSLINNYMLNESELISENGIILSNDGAKKINSSTLNKVYVTNFSSNSFYIGLDIKRFTNTYFDLNSSTHNPCNLTNIYFDFFFNGNINMENMQVVDSATMEVINYDVLHNSKGGFKYRKTGYRVGFELTSYVSEHSAVTFQIEGGVMPGIENVFNSQAPFGNKIFAVGRLMYSFGTMKK